MDYYTPKKAIVIAGSRVGSTMLCNALDSHPLISCDRTEPVNPKTSIYLREGLTVDQTLRIVLGRPGFQWCMCKVSYRQLRKHVSLEQLAALGVTKFIHLWRENALRVVVSAALNTAKERGILVRPTHSWETPPLQTITLEAEDMLAQARLYMQRVEQRKHELQGYDTLTLTYERIKPTFIPPTGYSLFVDSGNTILDFLNLETSKPIFCYSRLINPYPLSSILTNWDTIRPVLLNSEFAPFVESEDQ